MMWIEIAVSGGSFPIFAFAMLCLIREDVPVNTITPQKCATASNSDFWGIRNSWHVKIRKPNIVRFESNAVWKRSLENDVYKKQVVVGTCSNVETWLGNIEIEKRYWWELLKSTIFVAASENLQMLSEIGSGRCLSRAQMLDKYVWAIRKREYLVKPKRRRQMGVSPGGCPCTP